MEPITALVVPQPEETSLIGFQNLEDIRAPYLSFPMKMSKAWPSYVHDYPDFKEYEPVVITPNPIGDKAERIGIPGASGTSFRCMYFSGYQCYTDIDINNGAIINATLDYNVTQEQKELKLVEHCEAVLLCFSQDKTHLLPVRGSFRKAMSTIVKSMEKVVNTIREPQNPQAVKDWYGLSPVHAHTANYPVNYRFFAHVTVFSVPTRNDPSFKYPTARIKFEPTNDEIIALIQKHQKDNDFNSSFMSVCRSYAFRNKEIKSRLVKVVA